MTPSLWLLDTRRIDLASMRPLLSTDEQARADQYKQDGDVARFVTGRGALRRILGERTSRHPRALIFAEGHSGKPALRDHPSMHFNLSHSGDFVLIAVAPSPVGVDIEAMRDFGTRELAAMNFHRDEITAMEAQHDPHTAFFQLWAHKEAFLKATGIGLTDHLTEISIPLTGGRVDAPASLSPDIWYATPLDAPQGYAASIVCGEALPYPLVPAESV